MPGCFGAYIIFTVSMFGSCFAQNCATIVVTRFFGGGGSSVAFDIVGDSIADIWRGDAAPSLPMSILGFTSVAGIALGPVIGSAIVQIHKIDLWGWTFYIQIIFNAALIPIFWLVLKETHGGVILVKRAKKLWKETGQPIFAQSEIDKTSTLVLIKISFWRTAKMLLTEPTLTFFKLWVSFAWGILFLFFSPIVQIFQSALDTSDPGRSSQRSVHILQVSISSALVRSHYEIRAHLVMKEICMDLEHVKETYVPGTTRETCRSTRTKTNRSDHNILMQQQRQQRQTDYCSVEMGKAGNGRSRTSSPEMVATASSTS